MEERLEALVNDLADAGDPPGLPVSAQHDWDELERFGLLSTGERCYVALAAGRYDLLLATCEDPIEAWHRLDTRWRGEICRRRGWPAEWAVYADSGPGAADSEGHEIH